ncbi:MAG: XRE family transcriptional regulator [Bacteroidales bacterium]|nr:XRE family transcriptional regulator [Bacteroidales bacterium]
MSDRENIQQVASRLVGLRDALELAPEQVAEACGIDVDTYLGYESGNQDIPISFIQNLAQIYGVQVPELLFGTSPRMSAYYVTRAGKGARVERSKAYSYESLAEGFADRIIHPFMVTLEPANNATAKPNSHPGQEYNYVISGREELHIGAKTIVLNPGDSIIFNASLPHYMQALDEQPLQFISIIASK